MISKSQNIKRELEELEMAQMGRPKKDTLGVMVRLPVELIEAIDDVRRQQADLPTRPEMIRRMVVDWLDAERRQKEGL